ncbi:DUF6174 domain-containing protein [Nocardioides acrostichi]|uniref:Lipoprotein n=1 Tax=Nocardioides acrostichi TaxID=2784339 RepID=A0A930V107_9ACTN|nr:DUF6174 domain-containing protein [Nocardioides acrostichi]MBF4161896.1 hypothetical protein [Nocardioides acrostichi]
MRRSVMALVLVPVLGPLLGGCGDAPPTPTATTTSTATATATPSPTGLPTDYSFTLTTTCYCLDAGTPVRVTVRGGEVTAATYLRDATGRGTARAGAPAPPGRQLTLAEVVAQAERTDAASVDVDWPQGQTWPDEVRIDESARVADDEVAYTVSDVTVLEAS